MSSPEGFIRAPAHPLRAALRSQASPPPLVGETALSARLIARSMGCLQKRSQSGSRSRLSDHCESRRRFHGRCRFVAQHSRAWKDSRGESAPIKPQPVSVVAKFFSPSTSAAAIRRPLSYTQPTLNFATRLWANSTGCALNPLVELWWGSCWLRRRARRSPRPRPRNGSCRLTVFA